CTRRTSPPTSCPTRRSSDLDFRLDDEEWYELRIAAWLHDCGKVTTPVHVMDKATKLETITDRIDQVRSRFAVLERDAKIACLERSEEHTSELQSRENLVCRL